MDNESTDNQSDSNQQDLTPAQKDALALQDEVNRKCQEMAYTGGLNPDLMLQAFELAVRQTPEVLQCTRGSVMAAVQACATLGLAPTGVLGSCYFVPFNEKNKKTGQTEKKCTLIVGYRGLVDLMCRTGGVATVEAVVVYEGDIFKVTRGTNPEIIHNPDQEGGQDRPIKHVYAVATMKSGHKKFEVMSKAEVDKIRNASRSKDSPAWKYHYHEMAKKTVVRKLAKLTPTNPLAEQAMGITDESEGYAEERVKELEQANEERREAIRARMQEGQEGGTLAQAVSRAEVSEHEIVDAEAYAAVPQKELDEEQQAFVDSLKLDADANPIEEES